MRLIFASAVDVVESESMMVQEREKRRRLPKRGWRDGRKAAVTEEKRRKKATQKTLSWGRRSLW
jgi:hypothetical protein